MAPFATEEVEAHVPTRLPAGSYIARYTIMNGEEVKQEGELSLSILPYGSVQAAGYGFLVSHTPTYIIFDRFLLLRSFHCCSGIHGACRAVDHHVVKTVL
ncbi:MAG: hypothetical protein R3B69_00450 [Candidatus Paceibacterota bacterium]